MIQKDYTDSFILNALNLPTISDLDSLSDALAISKRLIFLLTKKTENYYKRFYIEKRDGTRRNEERGCFKESSETSNFFPCLAT